MKVFEEPIVNVVVFTVEDVITTSSGDEDIFTPGNNEGGLA